MQTLNEPHMVEFRCHAPTANAVFLAGTFNDWDYRSTPLARDADGTWSCALALATGFYHYKYVIDGRWCCEPQCPPCCTGEFACDRCVPNAHGTMDRVLIVA
jgi:1,4-alpha-glucan branching enzyme